jgi:hypothetical protein
VRFSGRPACHSGAIVLGFRKLRDVFAVILERDELAPAGPRDRRPLAAIRRRSNAYLVRCLSMAWQASWASASVLKGEPPILIALVF